MSAIRDEAAMIARLINEAINEYNDIVFHMKADALYVLLTREQFMRFLNLADIQSDRDQTIGKVSYHRFIDRLRWKI